MVTKRKPIVKKTRKPKKVYQHITKQIGVNILVEYHEKGRNAAQIANTYGVSTVSVYRYLKEHEYVESDLKKFSPDDVLKRVELSPLKRLELLTNDASQLLELTMACMRYKLNEEIDRTTFNKKDKTATVNVKDLTTFFEKAAPYVLNKKDASKNSKEGEDNNRTKRGLTLQMFKEKKQ